jgi:hypothetical protein
MTQGKLKRLIREVVEEMIEERRYIREWNPYLQPDEDEEDGTLVMDPDEDTETVPEPPKRRRHLTPDPNTVPKTEPKAKYGIDEEKSIKDIASRFVRLKKGR